MMDILARFGALRGHRLMSSLSLVLVISGCGAWWPGGGKEWTAPFEQSSGVWSAEIAVPCNRFGVREVGVRLDPAVPVDGYFDTSDAVSGIAKVSVSQGEDHLEREVMLEEQGGYFSSGKIHMIPLTRYSPLEGAPFCMQQSVRVTLEDITGQLERTSLTLYVSGDRRP